MWNHEVHDQENKMPFCQGCVIQLSNGPCSQLHLDWTSLEKYLKKISSSARPIIASSPDCVVFNCQSKFGTKHHKQRDTSHKPFPFTVRSNINKKNATQKSMCLAQHCDKVWTIQRAWPHGGSPLEFFFFPTFLTLGPTRNGMPTVDPPVKSHPTFA